MNAEPIATNVHSMPPQAQPSEAMSRSVRQIINEKPILVFSGLAIVWTALFLAS